MSQIPDDTPQTRHDPEAAQRTRVNLIAGLFILLLTGSAIWVAKLFHDQEQLQRCLDSRRTTCFELKEPPREGIRLPAH